jgi:hypothetical protein
MAAPLEVCRVVIERDGRDVERDVAAGFAVGSEDTKDEHATQHDQHSHEQRAGPHHPPLHRPPFHRT